MIPIFLTQSQTPAGHQLQDAIAEDVRFRYLGSVLQVGSIERSLQSLASAPSVVVVVGGCADAPPRVAVQELLRCGALRVVVLLLQGEAEQERDVERKLMNLGAMHVEWAQLNDQGQLDSNHLRRILRLIASLSYVRMINSHSRTGTPALRLQPTAQQPQAPSAAAPSPPLRPWDERHAHPNASITGNDPTPVAPIATSGLLSRPTARSPRAPAPEATPSERLSRLSAGASAPTPATPRPSLQRPRTSAIPPLSTPPPAAPSDADPFSPRAKGGDSGLFSLSPARAKGDSGLLNLSPPRPKGDSGPLSLFPRTKGDSGLLNLSPPRTKGDSGLFGPSGSRGDEDADSLFPRAKGDSGPLSPRAKGDSGLLNLSPARAKGDSGLLNVSPPRAKGDSGLLSLSSRPKSDSGLLSLSSRALADTPPPHASPFDAARFSREGGSGLHDIPAETPSPWTASKGRLEPSFASDPLSARSQRKTRPLFDLIGIGSSTGGLTALENIVSRLPHDFPIPICIVQHIGRGFDQDFVNTLQRATPLTVRLLQRPTEPESGTIYVCPSGIHLIIKPGPTLDLSEHPASHLYRPSVSVLFNSMADMLGDRCIGVLLTGMGQDGADGLLRIRQQGGRSLVQNRETCLVFGMPRAAIQLGAAEQVLPVGEIGPELLKLVKMPFGLKR